MGEEGLRQQDNDVQTEEKLVPAVTEKPEPCQVATSRSPTPIKSSDGESNCAEQEQELQGEEDVTVVTEKGPCEGDTSEVAARSSSFDESPASNAEETSCADSERGGGSPIISPA